MHFGGCHGVFSRIADGVSVSSSMRMQLGTLLMGSCVPIVTFKRQSISTPDFAVGDSMLIELEDCCWQIWWSPTSSTAAIRESQKCTEMILRLDFLIWGPSMMMTRMKKAGILVSHHSDDPRDDAASSCHAGTSKIKVPPRWESSLLGGVVSTAFQQRWLWRRWRRKATSGGYRAGAHYWPNICVHWCTGKPRRIYQPCRNGTAVFAHSQMNYGRPGVPVTILSNYFLSIKRWRVGCSHEILAGFRSLWSFLPCLVSVFFFI